MVQKRLKRLRQFSRTGEINQSQIQKAQRSPLETKGTLYTDILFYIKHFKTLIGRIQTIAKERHKGDFSISKMEATRQW